MGVPENRTSFCDSCDTTLAENLAQLPPEDAEKILASTRMMVKIIAARRGITLRKPEHAPCKLVPLHIVK